MRPVFFPLKIKGDDRGQLIPVELTSELPFPVKRIYFIKNVPSDSRRGFHAHHALRQLAYCLSGSCKIFLDNGREKVDVEINESTGALFIDPMIWHEMYEFSADCVLTMFASESYDEADYIRNYQDFLAITGATL